MANSNSKAMVPAMVPRPSGGNRARVPRQSSNNLLIYTDTPAARQVTVRPRAPRVNTRANSTRIEGHEQIATVNGSTAFGTIKYQVNPGLGFYTWLSSRATGWEKYKLQSFQVMYVPAEANTTTPGSVYLAADYDPTDPAPSTLQALSTYEHQVNGRVYNAMTLSLSPRRMFDGVQTKYVREGPVASDLSLYDAASFTFATISCASSAPIGQLWVKYVVDLISPQTESAASISPSYSAFFKGELADQTITPETLTTITFPEAIVNGAGLGYSAGTFTLPKANWHITGTVNMRAHAAAPFFLIPTVDGVGLNAAETALGPLDTAYVTIPFIAYVSSNGTNSFRLDCRTGANTDPTEIIGEGSIITFRVV